jgi:hypothetical protein
MKRTMYNTYDDGIILLVGLLQGQNSGTTYRFRISHRRESGTNTITTNNTNLVAIALALGNGYFPSFYSELGTTGLNITGVSTPAAEVTSSSFIAAADITGVGPDLYVNAQYLISSSGLNESTPQRMRGRNQLFLDDGTTLQAADAYSR